MPEFFDYDPTRGVRRLFDFDEITGTAYIRTEQDVDALLGVTRELRNTGVFDSKSREMHLWAVIPAVVQLELRKKGLDIFSKDQAMLRRVQAEIQANYPYLRTTEKTYV